jgi:hypothetical protein
MYHFSRAAIFAATIREAKALGVSDDELKEVQARCIYELALGLEALAYNLGAQPVQA